MGTVKSNPGDFFKEVTDSIQPGINISFNAVKVMTPSGRILPATISSITITENTNDTAVANGKPFIGFGEIEAGQAKTSTFKKQKDLKIPTGYSLKKATIYFTDAGFSTIETRNLYTTNLALVKELINRCQPGTAVILEKIVITDKSGNDLFLSSTGFILY